jgi:catechol 2,3-dioxygenase-like lactoylglutathione lyase family enzyme
MVAFTGMRHVHLKVVDVERAARFYEQGFGMERVMSKPDDQGRIVFLATPGGGDLLTLSDGSRGAEIDRSGRAGDNGGVDHFGFTLADQSECAEAVEQLVAAGATLIETTELAPGWPSAFLRDPDGYAFQI